MKSILQMYFVTTSSYCAAELGEDRCNGDIMNNCELNPRTVGAAKHLSYMTAAFLLASGSATYQRPCDTTASCFSYASQGDTSEEAHWTGLAKD